MDACIVALKKRWIVQNSKLRWDDLRVFLAVARAERISLAGQGLGLDTATVGRRVAALEEALGARLFDRSPRGYALTEAGSRLLDHAAEIEGGVAVAAEAVAGERRSLSGTVRIGAPDGVATYLLPGVCAGIRRLHPDLSLQVVALPRIFNLSRREADLAITVSPPAAGRLKVRKIARYGLGLYASRDFLTAHPVSRPEDVRDLPGIGYIGDMIFDKALDYDKLLGRARDPGLTSNSMIVQVNWVRAGAGLGILHDFAAAGHPELVRVLPRHFTLERDYWLVRHQDDARVARIDRTAELLAEGLRARLAAIPA